MNFRVSKKTLLFEAAFIWLIAGGILLFRGGSYLNKNIESLKLWILLICIFGGIGFYLLLFVRISHKHITRIKRLPKKKASILSFFDKKGYIMMASMILLGIVLKKTGIIPMLPMAYFYFFMGTPLFISALRFLYEGAIYKKEDENE